MCVIKTETYRALQLALLLLVLLLVLLQVLVMLSSPPPQALPPNCWHVQPRLLWYQPIPVKTDMSSTQLHTSESLCPSLPALSLPGLPLTLLTGAGVSEELLMLPFSHMFLMLRVPPVGISANGDLGDLTSLFACGNRGWIYLLLHGQKLCSEWRSEVEST